MAMTAKQALRGFYQRRDGALVYAREAYEIRGVATDPAPAPGEIILQAAGLPGSPVPSEGEALEGLAQSAYVVQDNPFNGSRRQLIVTWGSRRVSLGSINTETTRVRTGDSERMIQPWLTIRPGPNVSYYKEDAREISRGKTTIYKGKLLDASFDPVAVGDIAAANENKLYLINGQPAILRGVSIDELQSNQNFIWTIFERRGWVKEVPSNTIEQGQRAIAELYPMAEYGQVSATGAYGTPVVDAEDLYDTGDPLPWL